MDFNKIRVYIATELYSKYLMASSDTVDTYQVAKIAVEDADILIEELNKNHE